MKFCRLARKASLVLLTCSYMFQVMIGGPYGAPATNAYSFEHAVLIGAGIGVTPFASLLKSMMLRRKRRRAICPNCNYWWKIPEADSLAQVPRKVRTKLKEIIYLWNRGQKACVLTTYLHFFSYYVKNK